MDFHDYGLRPIRMKKWKLLPTTLDAVYIDAKKTKPIILIKPKPPFRPIFQVAASHEGPISELITTQ
jgi:hypothetical protein